MTTYRCMPLLLFSALTLLTVPTYGAPITGWVEIFDGDSDSTISGNATSSPSIDDAHKTSIAANFSPVTLNTGESLTLTGMVSFSSNLISGQFRWGLFDGDTPPVIGEGTGYAGFYASAPDSGSSASLASSDGVGTGSVNHPFVSAATTILGNMPTTTTIPSANTSLYFTLTLTRDGANMNLFASVTDSVSYNASLSLEDQAVVPSDFTYNSVALLVGGGFAADTDATFSNLDVTYVPEPGGIALLGFGSVMLLHRRMQF